MKILGTVAPAKINIGLRVGGRRADGFHDIDTVFYRVALSDRLLFAATDSPTIDIDLRAAPAIPLHDNLVYRAATLLRETTGATAGASIVLEKRIPSGAGLGGGSSDAATTLLALNALWELSLDDAQLHSLAARLGSDVPFFLLNAPAARARGRGEQLEPLDLVLPYWVVLVNPGLHISTPWAYARLNRSAGPVPTPDVVPALRSQDPEQLRSLLVNDFEPAVFAAYPELAGIKQRLYELGAVFALMSGSGSTLFGLFPTEQCARTAADHLSPLRTEVCPPASQTAY